MGSGVVFAAKQTPNPGAYRGLMLAGSFFEGNAAATEGIGAELVSGESFSSLPRFTPTDAHVFAAIRSGGTAFRLTVDRTIDAAPAAIGANDDFSAPGEKFHIGEGEYPSQKLAGRIGEVILLVSPTTAEISSTTDALMKKYRNE